MKRVTLLWHGDRAIGICVFAAPARALHLRRRYFNPSVVTGRADTAEGRRLALRQLNRQLWLLARVVLHPTYRGAGVAADFVRRSCQSCPVPWIETLSALGHLHPFFEKAGFTRVGIVRKRGRSGDRAQRFIYGDGRLTAATLRKSAHAEPVYYVFDKRQQ